MKSFFSWSVRTHLLLLVLAATIPALALVWWSGQELQRMSVEKTQEATRRLVLGMTDDLEQVEENARVLLTTLSNVPTIKMALFKICVETYPASPIPAQPRSQFAEFCTTPLLSSVWNHAR